MMKPSHYQTYVDVLVGTYMGEDDRITLRTTCALVEHPSEPVPELRELLTRTSEVRRPQENGYCEGFTSRSNPADIVREMIKLKVVPTYGNILQDVDGIVKDLEVGTMGATIKLMTALSLVAPRERDTTRVTRWMSQTLKDMTTTEDRIVFWAGAAILYPLDVLLGVKATTGLRETVDHLIMHPFRMGWR
jgi:hypothetical protein